MKASGIVVSCEPRLLYHLVGPTEDSDRDVEAERLGGLEIEGQFEFACLLDRKICRLRSLENAGDINAGKLVRLRCAVAIAHQSAVGDELTERVSGRDAMP